MTPPGQPHSLPPPLSSASLLEPDPDLVLDPQSGSGTTSTFGSRAIQAWTTVHTGPPHSIPTSPSSAFLPDLVPDSDLVPDPQSGSPIWIHNEQQSYTEVGYVSARSATLSPVTPFHSISSGSNTGSRAGSVSPIWIPNLDP
jgi:hypothetical protein